MNNNNSPQIGLVLPCYNEEQILPETARQLGSELRELIEAGAIAASSRIYFVDDGSSDQTWTIIAQLAAEDSMFRGIKLSRNYGHQRALYAGLLEAEGDALISMDADLQDDISAIGEMVASFCRGHDVVYGVRDNRESDSSFKRGTASLHYWLLGRMGIATVPNHADYRLMSRRAVEFLGQYRERNLYLRGIIPQLGLPSDKVYYARGERTAGESKYPFHKMLALSVQGITSFSIMPLRFISLLGLLVLAISIGLGGWALYASLWGPGTAPGWASTVIPIYLLGGLQLFAIGVAGEYIGKSFIESKQRPLYQVESRCGESAKAVATAASDVAAARQQGAS